MKHLYIFLLACLPMMLQAQEFTFIPETDTVQDAEVNQKPVFYHIVRNDSSFDLDIQWRLFDHFGSLESWDDNICEGIELCYPPSTRTESFTLKSGDSVLIYHYINAYDVPGSGSSEVCFFDPADSAGTVICQTVYADVVMPDTLAIYLDGVYAFVIDGDTYEIYDGEYVTLGYDAPVLNSEYLSQNSPNPFSSQSTINYAFSGTDGEITVHDLTGKMIHSVKLKNNKGRIQLGSDLQAGLYFYSLKSNGVVIDTKRMQVLD